MSSPSWALVVDLMFHVIRFIPIEVATAFASIVFTVPGSPLIRSGFLSALATLTALISSSDAIYVSVLLNPFSLIPIVPPN